MNKLEHMVYRILIDVLHFRIGESVWKEGWRFIKFALVGISNTFINYILYLILVAAGCNYILANTIGFLVSVLNAYYWNNKYVFNTEDGERRTWWKTLLKTFMAYMGTGLVLNNILLLIWIDKLGINKAVAPIINVLIVTPLNFVLNKLWAYRNK